MKSKKDAYCKMTDEDFDRLLSAQVGKLSPGQILALPGAYEVFSEELNNEVLDAWQAERLSRCYYQEIKEPRNMQEGLANFVQMIINELEAGNHREALLKAVDLLNDLIGKEPVYKVKG
jgi:hypothetical protein